MKRGKKMPDARLADARLGAHSNDARYQTRRCQTWHALPGPFFRPSPPAVYLPLFLGYWLFHIENVQGQTPDKLLTSIFSHYPYGAGSKLRFDLLVIRNFFLPPPSRSSHEAESALRLICVALLRILTLANPGEA